MFDKKGAVKLAKEQLVFIAGVLIVSLLMYLVNEYFIGGRDTSQAGLLGIGYPAILIAVGAAIFCLLMFGGKFLDE